MRIVTFLFAASTITQLSTSLLMSTSASLRDSLCSGNDPLLDINGLVDGTLNATAWSLIVRTDHKLRACIDIYSTHIPFTSLRIGQEMSCVRCQSTQYFISATWPHQKVQVSLSPTSIRYTRAWCSTYLRMMWY